MGLLVLTRREGERIKVDGPCWITMLRAGDGRARLGIEAAPEVKVLREELVESREDAPCR